MQMDVSMTCRELNRIPPKGGLSSISLAWEDLSTGPTDEHTHMDSPLYSGGRDWAGGYHELCVYMVSPTPGDIHISQLMHDKAIIK